MRIAILLFGTLLLIGCKTQTRPGQVVVYRRPTTESCESTGFLGIVLWQSSDTEYCAFCGKVRKKH